MAIMIPSLRQRRDDIGALTAHYNRLLGKDIRFISGRAMAVLTAYDWPGNVRELSIPSERVTHTVANTDVIAQQSAPTARPVEALKSAQRSASLNRRSMPICGRRSQKHSAPAQRKR